MICTRAFLTQPNTYAMYMYIVNDNYNLLWLSFSLLFFALYQGIFSLFKIIGQLQKSDKERIFNEIISFFYIFYYIFSPFVKPRIMQIFFIIFQYLIIIYCFSNVGQFQNTIPNVNKYVNFLTKEITFLFIFICINYKLSKNFGKKSVDSYIFINSLLITNEIVQCIFSHFIIAFALTHQENFDNFIFKINNILNMIFSALRVVIPLSISAYYLLTVGFKENIAIISLLHTIAFINVLFFLPTLIKFIKRMHMNRKVEKIFRTAKARDLKDRDICIICRLQMYPKKAKKLPCKHCYHLECLERWIAENDSCPICLEKISDLLDKEMKMKEKRKKQRKHRRSKKENKNNDVYNYNNFDVDEQNDEQGQNANDNLHTERDVNIQNDETANEIIEVTNENNDEIENERNEIYQENPNVNNKDNICNNCCNDENYEDVIDLDKICSNNDVAADDVDDANTNDYSYDYSGYYDESDKSIES